MIHDTPTGPARRVSLVARGEESQEIVKKVPMPLTRVSSLQTFFFWLPGRLSLKSGSIAFALPSSPSV